MNKDSIATLKKHDRSSRKSKVKSKARKKIKTQDTPAAPQHPHEVVVQFYLEVDKCGKDIKQLRDTVDDLIRRDLVNFPDLF